MTDDFQTALAHLRASGFALGPDWTRAHEIAQAHEGEKPFDALHALLHRIEGDRANAAYWDRRAGTAFADPDPAAELARIAALAG